MASIRRWAAVPASCIALMFAGCSTTGDIMGISSHPSRASDYRAAVRSENTAAIAKAADSIGRRSEGSDQVLYLMERGRLNALAGQPEASREDFQIASDLFEEERMSPVVSVGSGFFSAAAVASNDLAIPYRAPGFERVMLHNFQALNYLWMGETELARIELNRAALEQEHALQENEKIVREAAQRADQRGLAGTTDTALGQARIPLGYADGVVRNSFQNAFTFYLSAVLFEILGDPNRALIEYKRALEIYPWNKQLARDALRAALASDDPREFERLAALHPDSVSAARAAHEASADRGRVVVLFEQGLVTPRESIRIPFIWDDTLQQVVIPYYPGRFTAPTPLRISGSEGDLPSTRTDLVCDLDVMSAKALSEMMPAILVRQTLRVLAKHEMTRIARREGGDWGLIGATIYNVLTDQADLRSWLTLPANLQVADLWLPPGVHPLELEHSGLSGGPIEIEVTSHQTVILWVRKLGNQLVADWVPVVPSASTR